MSTIIQSRLEGVPGNLVDPFAVGFAARKVAAVSGDARRALDICRRAVELVETRTISQDMDEEAQPATPSRKGRGSKGETLATTKQSNIAEKIAQSTNGTSTGTNKKYLITHETIRQAINEATSSPLQRALRALPLASKVFLAALLARIRRTGIGEAVLGDVVDEVKRLGLMSQLQPVHQYLLTPAKYDTLDANSGLRADLQTPSKHRDVADTGSKLSTQKAARGLALSLAATELAEAGIIGVEARHGERVGRVRLGVGEDEVRLALGEDESVKGLGFGS